MLHAVGRCRARLGKEALGKARQLRGPDGLVQMHAAVAGNLAQAIGRDVACQDDGRDCVLSLLLQPGDGLEPVEALRQVVVGDDQVRHGRPLGRQLQRRVPICGDQSAVTLVVEKQLQHFEHCRIVFDDQDRAAGGCALLRLSSGSEPAAQPAPARPSGTSMVKTEPAPRRERTSILCPSRSARRCTMARPRPRPLLRSRAGLSS